MPCKKAAVAYLSSRLTSGPGEAEAGGVCIAPILAIASGGNAAWARVDVSAGIVAALHGLESRLTAAIAACAKHSYFSQSMHCGSVS